MNAATTFQIIRNTSFAITNEDNSKHLLHQMHTIHYAASFDEMIKELANHALCGTPVKFL